MFNIQGVMETEKEVSRIYKAFEKEENFSRTEDDAPHASTKKNREAMYAFFQKHLNNPGNPNDEETQLLSKEEIQVTPTGQISTSMGGESVFTLNRKDAEKLAAKLQEARNDISTHIPAVLSSSRILSGYIEPKNNEIPVFSGRIQRADYSIEKYFIRGEGDYVIPYLLFKPNISNNKALIYLHNAGKLVESGTGGEIEWFVKNGFIVLAPDIIGVGEMGPGIFKGDAYIEGNSHNIWYASMLIGRSIAGVRAGDVVRLATLLKSKEGISEIYGLSRREMAPVMLHAAAFSQDIKCIALVEPYSSYLSIVMNRFYTQTFIHNTVPGALKSYDLPDLAASLAPRKLLIAGSIDGNSKTLDYESLSKETEIIKKAYQGKNASANLKIVPGEIIEKPYNLYQDWIK
jgi:hypothetical protein